MKKNILFIALICFMSCNNSVDPIASQQTPPGFVMIEYWTCPAENLAALRHASDSIWAPIFYEMAEEGYFLAWGSMKPVEVVEISWDGEKEERKKLEPNYQMVSYWHSESKEEFDKSWKLFENRLKERFPDDPRPSRFCNQLRVVNYDAQWIQ